MVIIGHNDRIAWGSTYNGATVRTLRRQLHPASPDEYTRQGRTGPSANLEEIIRVKGRPENTSSHRTRHGPVFHREGDKAFALRWTATDPGGLANSYNGRGKLATEKEFREIMKRVWGQGSRTRHADVEE